MTPSYAIALDQHKEKPGTLYGAPGLIDANKLDRSVILICAP